METFYGTQIIVSSQKSGVLEGCLNFLTLKQFVELEFSDKWG